MVFRRVKWKIGRRACSYVFGKFMVERLIGNVLEEIVRSLFGEKMLGNDRGRSLQVDGVLRMLTNTYKAHFKLPCLYIAAI